MHLARAVLSVLMLWCFVWALARMSMANTYAITLSAPLLVVPFAALFLKEKTGRPRLGRDTRRPRGRARDPQADRFAAS